MEELAVLTHESQFRICQGCHGRELFEITSLAADNVIVLICREIACNLCDMSVARKKRRHLSLGTADMGNLDRSGGRGNSSSTIA